LLQHYKGGLPERAHSLHITAGRPLLSTTIQYYYWDSRRRCRVHRATKHVCKICYTVEQYLSTRN